MSPSTPQTVSMWSILCLCVSILICFGVPIGLAIWAKLKYKKAFSFVPLLLGVAGFTIFQIIIRVSILLPLLQSNNWVIRIVTTMPWLYAAFLCLTAGLFEEPVRFLAFTILKKKRQFPDGLSYGIGHGGIEAIGIVGLALINNLIYAIMINAGSWNTITALVSPVLQGQYDGIRQALISTSSPIFLLSGAERLFTVFVQIALTLVVLRGFMVNKRWLYLAVATLLHALIDFGAVSLQILKVNPLIIEGTILIEAVLVVLYIVKQAKDWRRSLAQPHEVPAGLPEQVVTE